MPAWIGPGLIALFLLPALGFAGYSIADRWYQGYQLGLEEEDLRHEIDVLRRRNVRLQEELVLARSDEQIERIAREELNLVKPGDRAVVIVAPQASRANDPALRREAMPTPEKPAWRKLLDAIFKRERP